MKQDRKQPKIGIISFIPSIMDNKNFITRANYILSILDAGGMPVVIPISEDVSRCTAYVDLIDGLLVPGGEDVSPRLYGEDPVCMVRDTCYEKDMFECELVRLAAKAGKPIFGICRGQQVINTAFGGTLIQDIPSQVGLTVCHSQAGERRSEMTHSIRCKQGSIVHQVLGEEKYYVNSFHHQCVKELAPGFIATAWASDGVVEAMESKDGKIWSVQFHPEDLYRHYHVFRGLFDYLIKQASAKE